MDKIKTEKNIEKTNEVNEINDNSNIIDTIVKILDKQVLNFETDPSNHFARMNNEEIMRE